jgi:hypothetical protein
MTHTLVLTISHTLWHAYTHAHTHTHGHTHRMTHTNTFSRPGSMAGWLWNLRPKRKTSDSDTGKAAHQGHHLLLLGASTSAGQWPHGDPSSTTRIMMARDSGKGKAAGTSSDLGPSWQVKSFHRWKYSPCPRARMQGPTGPGPGIRTGPGRTPGRTAAAAHHLRHRTGTTLGDFTRKLQTQRTDLAARNPNQAGQSLPWGSPLAD